ncbi:MAG: glycoside hydrolase [Acidobacteriia bacterium]|nr:glycoside hydrolase [Terriglobia bacterium]
MKRSRPLAAALFAFAAAAFAASYDSKFFAEMRWRSIGPYRGGRTRATAGVPSQPNVFYIGVCNGGVWKTTDYGRTWIPVFDDQPTNSIGAIAVSPSDPNIVYVASGEGLQRPDLSTGDGIYRSSDAGKTWTHLGLRDGQQIPAMAVDPHDPNRLFVAVLGHPYGPNAERGIFRSTDGGRTFEKVLYKDENTGGSDVELDPANPGVVYAALWEARQGPWENAAWSGTNGGVFKSTDGGTTWRQITGGLDGVVQANLSVSPTDPRRIYATVATTGGTCIYRSDDAGESWARITSDARPAGRIGGGDLPFPMADPKNPDTVYVTSTVCWKSTDGGKTWTGFRGAPGGDDYQHGWINPNHPEIILLASDQGAIVTVNGGQSWSSWYNQPTAQMYHVNTDNDFPYRVCSGQQESGSACVSSRGNDGQVTFREWHPVGVEEYGYAVPDPLDPNLVYGGKITRYDRRTGQVENVAPTPIRSADFRAVRTQPVVFSQKDPRVLFFASNTLWKTSNGGESWQQVSPDLTRKTWSIPASIGKYRETPAAQPTPRGVIYAVAPSPLDINRIWAGTDDGLIHLTTDGGRNWNDVTPPQLVPWAKVSIIDAGHFDPNTAYAAINTFRLDDLRPHIFRTHDGGKTWTEIVSGIPAGAAVNAVREDPQTRGLLFAGSENQVYVSFDEGDHWQSLRLNMPASSIRDLAIKDDDLIAATHGRGFWILDDITPLRQLNAQIAGAPAFLFKPQDAIRVRWNMNTDTPLPPDEPAGQNPPDGAILDYYLASAASAPVTLEILDGAGALVRRYSSADPLDPIPANLNIPTYWVRPPRSLSAAPGMHRWLWDMHYTPLSGGRGGYGMQAIVHDTPLGTTSIWAAPGPYTVRLTVDGRNYAQPLTVKMDPRVKPAGVQQQSTLSKQVYDDALAASQALERLRAMRAEIRKRGGDALASFDQRAAALEGGGMGGGRGGRGVVSGSADTLAGAAASLTSLIRLLDEADVAPTTQLAAAVAERRKAAAAVMQRWKTLEADFAKQ